MSTTSSEIRSPDDAFWSHRVCGYIARALLLACAAIIVLTFLDYGVTYDEDWRLTYGKYVVDWYLSGFKDASALHFWVLSFQGGFTAAVEHLAAWISPVGRFETVHIVNALFGLLGLVGTYKLGTLLGGRFVGLLSGLTLALTPRFYGDMFNNMLDVPTASLTVISLYYLVQLLRSLPDAPKRLVVKLGLIIGLTLGIRPGAVILVACTGAGISMWLVRRWLLTRESIRRILSSYLLRLTLVFAGVCLTAYLTMLVWWPAAQVRPFYQPAKGLWWASHFEYEVKVLFDGSVWSNRDLPWYYLPKWFLITTPEFTLLGLCLGLVLLTWLTLRKGIRTWIEADLGLIVISIVSFFPIVYAALTAPPEFDGVRHFLFVLPGLAVLAAFSLAEVLRRVGPWLRMSVIMLFIGSLLLTGVDMVRLHPYQYVFFNRLFAGGLKTAASSYETDYWGASYKEGVEWLVAHYPIEPGQRPKVGSCLHPASTAYFLPRDRFEFVGSYNGEHPLFARPDIFLATTRWGCDHKETGRVLHTVSRMGVPLLFVIEVNPSARQLSESASDRQ